MGATAASGAWLRPGAVQRSVRRAAPGPGRAPRRALSPRPDMDQDDDDSCGGGGGLDAVPRDDDDDDLLLLGAVRDHHDYAKRRRCSDRENLAVAVTVTASAADLVELAAAAAAPAPKRSKAAQGPGRGRQLRDPEGGTYISARSRARKEPLPMKLRALPASFWEQPNLNKGPSPGAIFSALPPLGPPLGPPPPGALLGKDDGPDGARDSPRGAHPSRGPGSGAEPGAPTASGLVTHSPADTDLLFSLFRSVEPKTNNVHRRTRGRPRRVTAAPGAGRAGRAGGQEGQRDDDPCLLGSTLLTSTLTCRQM
ncbi:DNA topoisomerase 1, partial [Frankliniella fusca]